MARTMDDEYLVEQFLQGDQDAFECIVERYQGAVACLANRVMGWPGEVEDVVQEVFLAVYRNLKRFRGQCTLKTWIYTITLNQCRSLKYRWRIRAGYLSLRIQKTPESGPSMDVSHEVRESVRRAILGLPVRYREPVVLKYLEELPTDEICRVLGISSNTLNVRLNRAREKLRPLLERLINDHEI